MPYYLYTPDNQPTWTDGQSLTHLHYCRADGFFPSKDAEKLRVFEDAKTANACRIALNKQERTTGVVWAPVLFVPTRAEANDWRDREKRRLDGRLPEELDKDGSAILYARVPWCNDDWYLYGPYSPDACQYQNLHYVHMSRVMPGQVAFTPSEDYGVQNRKVRMTVARYLEKFAKGENGRSTLTAREIARYVALVKAHADQDLHLARTVAEIVAVYMNGPNSCMSHDVSTYSTGGVHPVSAYAGSDLAVAFCGTPATGISARSVVWPEKKIYTRIYGDMTLEHVLQQNGYGKGTLDGAKIPAVHPPYKTDDWLLPYIDAAESASLITVGGKQYLRLSADEDGDWQVKNTNGLAEPREDEYTCSHCETSISASRANTSEYCENCDDDHWSCVHCGEDSFDRADAYCEDDNDYCESCHSRLFARCAECDQAYRKDDDRASKRARGVQEYCSDCGDDKMICDVCEDLVDDHATETSCEDCRAKAAEETEREDATAATPATEKDPTT